MRCQDFEREYDAPTGALDAPSLRAHRAGCPTCDALAARAEAFDRLWVATSPDAPAPGAFDRVWAAVEAREGISLPVSAPINRAWWALPGLAAAAALLLALLPRVGPIPGPVRQSGEPSFDVVSNETQVVRFQVIVEPGQIAQIHILDDGAVQVARRSAADSMTDFELSNKATMLSSVGP